LAKNGECVVVVGVAFMVIVLVGCDMGGGAMIVGYVTLVSRF
jgi:hypothetical protein